MPQATTADGSATSSITRLAPGPRIASAPARLDSVSDAILLGQAGRTTVVGTDGGQPLSVIEAEVRVPVPCAGECLGLGWSRGALRAFSLPQGRERWASDVLPAGSSTRVGCVQVSGQTALVELDWAPTPQETPQRVWIALDHESGAVLWRRDPGEDQWFCPWPGGSASGDAFVYRTAGGGVGLARARTGERLWQVDAPAASPDWIVADEHGVVVAGVAGPIVSLDQKGDRRSVHEVPGRQIAAIAMERDRVWVLTWSAESREQGVETPVLHLLDRKSGAAHQIAPWKTITGGGTPHARAGSEDAGLWVTEQAIFANAGDGILRALDRTSGAELWHWGIGDGALITMVTSGSLTRPVVRVGSEVWLFEPHAAAAGSHEVEIHGQVAIAGRPASRVPVVVGDSLVETDERGHYRARVRTRGRIQIHTGVPCAESDDAFEGNAEVVIGGASRRLQADIAAELQGCE
jgi:outer membrane protein assembly factor BamB